jgi:hypothetical protein
MPSVDLACSPTNGRRGWNRYCNTLIAAELKGFVRYCRRVVQYAPTEADQGTLRACLGPKVSVATDTTALKPLLAEEGPTAIVLNGALNHDYDVQGLLSDLHAVLPRTAVIGAVIYNPNLSFLYRLANWLGIRKGAAPTTFLSKVTLKHIAHLSGFHICRTRHAVYCPFKWFGLGDIINTIMPWIPILRRFSLAYIVSLKPIKPLSYRPSLSIVIPARNESGHITQAISRIPDIGGDIEIIFVEGHSSDDTWDQINKVKAAYNGPWTIRAFQQTGKGKCDAVRLGFEQATGELLTILDADLTMPPEKLPQFYDAYVSGKADFINGSRLVYPMEGDAMRPLNLMGNRFFARALSWVLDTPITDSLCGTKLMSRVDYQRFTAWRHDFGDFDPFGDFELIFPAAVMGLGIVDVPVRYRARQYGETNISRFRHGLILLKMTWIGFWKIKIGQVKDQSE